MRRSTAIWALAGGLVLSGSALAPPNRAQVATNGTVRIRTTPAFVQFWVDGQGQREPATFNWPAGSKHTLYALPEETTSRPGIRYRLNGWLVGNQALSDGNPATVTADPSIQDIRADYAVDYALQVSLITCSEPPCSSPGRVYAGGTLVTETTTVWSSPGGTVILQAVPNPGFVFAGWSNNNRGQLIQGFINTVTLSEPMNVTPIFQPARRFVFDTVPAGLTITADRAVLATPASIEWGRGSTHSLMAASPQQDQTGSWWVFTGWDHGGAATQAFTVDSTVSEGRIVANFSPAMRVTLATAPVGLRLKIDGRDGLPPYNPVWGVGDTHQVEAPQQQTDAQGRLWVFDRWSDGLAAAHSMTVPNTDTGLGMRLTATYKQLGRISVTSNQTGVTVLVDGVECRLPCSVDRPLGATVRIAAPQVIPLGEASRAEFDRWSDGATGVASLAAASEPKTLSANYRTLYRLVVAADPAEGAALRATPESADGFYDSSAVVSVSAAPLGGFRFRRWEGDISAPGPQGTVLMSQPRAARAIFDRVPYLPPSAVRNAAADLGSDGVAAGSVVALVGSNLAAGAVTGPESPLPQTLGDVTVRAGDKLLPLFFVSPERITAQLPPDLAEGATVLAARSGNQDEVRADLKIVRNAPGLFATAQDDRSWAVASHPDGSAVTAAAPARPGEKITIFGTGFGPTEPMRPWGFAVPADPVFRLSDAVEVRVAGTSIPAESAAAAPGRVGIDAVAFLVPAGLSGVVTVETTVGGRTSNTVQLPVE